MSDDHPIIETIKSYATNLQDESVDGIVGSLAALPDGFRAEVLNKLKGWIAADDGSSLRQRSQLWNLTRRMNTFHQYLRKVGR